MIEFKYSCGHGGQYCKNAKTCDCDKVIDAAPNTAQACPKCR